MLFKLLFAEFSFHNFSKSFVSKAVNKWLFRILFDYKNIHWNYRREVNFNHETLLIFGTIDLLIIEENDKLMFYINHDWEAIIGNCNWNN